MNDFTEILLAFGRGIVKILISALVGVGLLLFGITTAGKQNIWQMRQPPGELFLSIGAGLLSGGGMMLLLFLLPWLFKGRRQPMYRDEPMPRDRPAPPPTEEPRRSSIFEK